MTLLKRFGKQSSNVLQIPQIIISLELQIVQHPNKTFALEYFKNELPDFLILKHDFEENHQQFLRLMGDHGVVNQVFDTKMKNFNKVKVLEISAKEPTLYPLSPWESIIY